MRWATRPITILYVFLILIAVIFSRFVAEEMNSFEAKTFSMREGYLNEICAAISGSLATTAVGGKLDPDLIAQGFKGYEDLDVSGYYDSEIKGIEALQISVTNENGQILYKTNDAGDSLASVPQPEVVAALNGQYHRRDVMDDEGYVTTFIARPIESNGRIIGAVVAAKSNRKLDPLVKEAKQGFIAVGIGLGTLVLLTVMALFLFFLRPLQLWFRYAQQFQNQNHPARPQLRRTSFGYLGAAIDHLYDSLSDRSYIENLIKKFVHELKSPIATIRCSGELLQRDIPQNQRTEIVRDIVLQSDRMHALVMRMLSLAALEKRDSLKELEQFRLKDVIAALLDEIHAQVQASHVEIKTDIPDDITVYCDSLLLKSAIANLVLNAIEHSPRGSLVELSAIAMGGLVDIRVRDHGGGIPDFAMDRIFEPFYTLPKLNGDNIGTGLGLPFVREVADLHFGNIAITNHKDGGVLAIFSIRR